MNGEVLETCCLVAHEARAAFALQPEVTNLDLPGGALAHAENGRLPPRVRTCVREGGNKQGQYLHLQA